MMFGTVGWESKCKAHYTNIKKSSMVCWSSYGSDQGVCLEDLLVADGFGL